MKKKLKLKQLKIQSFITEVKSERLIRALGQGPSEVDLSRNSKPTDVNFCSHACAPTIPAPSDEICQTEGGKLCIPKERTDER